MGELTWLPLRRALGVTGFGIALWEAADAGDELIERHDETTTGAGDAHEELYLVLDGRATFTVDGEEIDAPAGTIVFVRDPALLRAARATADDTTIFMVGGPAGVPYTVSRWETSLP